MMGGGRWCISVCSDAGSWINGSIPGLIDDWLTQGYEVRWALGANTLPEGDVCFYLSYGQIVGANILKRHKNNLVVHASDLPKGRGWSPLTWQIIEGEKLIPVTLFEAAEAVDSGPNYKQLHLHILGSKLIHDLRKAIAEAMIGLCRFFVSAYPGVVQTGLSQKGEPSLYARRQPDDSFKDVDKSRKEQFNLLRTVDNNNYPAWFELNGERFKLLIEILDNSSVKEPQKKN